MSPTPEGKPIKDKLNPPGSPQNDSKIGRKLNPPESPQRNRDMERRKKGPSQ